MKEQLHSIKGLGRRQIEKMAHRIDWTIPDTEPDLREKIKTYLPGIILSSIVAIVLIILLVPMIEILFDDFGHWMKPTASGFKAEICPRSPSEQIPQIFIKMPIGRIMRQPRLVKYQVQQYLPQLR